MKTLTFSPSLSPTSTKVHIGENILSSLQELYAGPNIVICDSNLAHLHDLSTRLNAPLICVPSGESAKSSLALEALCRSLSELHCDRHTTLIAVGGGSTTDLVGFAASIYLRGVSLILVPTTLLAMVDASIGGKNGINTHDGKNLLGTFYPPKAVFVDLKMLSSLPQQEWLNGLAEILKIGLVYDASLFTTSRNNLDLIIQAIEAKIHVIEKDPMEHSIRRILNFGHTVAHALENLSGYTFAHGLAVAIGCIIESHLSMTLGYLSQEDFAKIQAAYASFPLTLPTSYSQKKLIEAMSFDKKRAGKTIRCVLIDKIGHAVSFDDSYCCSIEPSQWQNSLTWMETHYG